MQNALPHPHAEMLQVTSFGESPRMGCEEQFMHKQRSARSAQPGAAPFATNGIQNILHPYLPTTVRGIKLVISCTARTAHGCGTQQQPAAAPAKANRSLHMYV